jgi:hypothetical protein
MCPWRRSAVWVVGTRAVLVRSCGPGLALGVNGGCARPKRDKCGMWMCAALGAAAGARGFEALK